MKSLTAPGRLIPLVFSIFLTIGTVLLCLPISRVNSADPPNVLAAAFTAVSASCVTGLTVVDTATYWTTFGQFVIMVLIQVGGFGIMTMATLLAILAGGRLGLSQTLVAQSETSATTMGNVKGILRTVGITVVLVEAVVAFVLAIRFYVGYGYSVGQSLWQGVFHSISAFNNAGFALFSDNLISFNQDIYIIGPICAAIVAGGLGFPVFYELYRRWRTPSTWTVHSKVTILGYLALLAVGCVGFALAEWSNPNTLGPMSVWGKAVNSLIGGITPRTAGFNAIDYGLVSQETLALNDGLMFIGGGSAGTAGGIRSARLCCLPSSSGARSAVSRTSPWAIGGSPATRCARRSRSCCSPSESWRSARWGCSSSATSPSTRSPSRPSRPSPPWGYRPGSPPRCPVSDNSSSWP